MRETTIWKTPVFLYKCGVGGCDCRFGLNKHKNTLTYMGENKIWWAVFGAKRRNTKINFVTFLENWCLERSFVAFYYFWHCLGVFGRDPPPKKFFGVWGVWNPPYQKFSKVGNSSWFPRYRVTDQFFVASRFVCACFWCNCVARGRDGCVDEKLNICCQGHTITPTSRDVSIGFPLDFHWVYIGF